MYILYLTQNDQLLQLSTAQAWATDLKVADKPTNHIKQSTMQQTIYTYRK